MDNEWNELLERHSQTAGRQVDSWTSLAWNVGQGADRRNVGTVRRHAGAVTNKASLRAGLEPGFRPDSKRPANAKPHRQGAKGQTFIDSPDWQAVPIVHKDKARRNPVPSLDA